MLPNIMLMYEKYDDGLFPQMIIYRISSNKRPGVYYFQLLLPPALKRDPAFIRGPALIISYPAAIQIFPKFEPQMP